MPPTHDSMRTTRTTTVWRDRRFITALSNPFQGAPSAGRARATLEATRRADNQRDAPRAQDLDEGSGRPPAALGDRCGAPAARRGRLAARPVGLRHALIGAAHLAQRQRRRLARPLEDVDAAAAGHEVEAHAGDVLLRGLQEQQLGALLAQFARLAPEPAARHPAHERADAL